MTQNIDAAIPSVTPVTPGAPRVTYRLTWARVLRSEWSKLWSVRSTPITLALALLALIAFGMLTSALYDPQVVAGPPGQQVSGDPVSLALSGSTIALLAIGVLGVMVTAGEYSTGMIRSTLAAVPRRLPVLWAKTTNYGLLALFVATVGLFGSFLLGSVVRSDSVGALDLSDTGVVRSLLGAGLYLALVGVIGVALGSLMRSVAGGIAVLVGAFMVVPGLLLLLPSAWQDAIGPYMPSNAGSAMSAMVQGTHQLSPAAGGTALAAWTLAVLAASAWRLVRSDA